jgi:hypothetical protein
MDVRRSARRLARGRWGARYVNALATANDGSKEDACAALEIALAALFARLPEHERFDRVLPRLTDAIVQALFRGKERLGPSRREREDEAILAFAERVCARVEPHLEDCLTAELLWFFLGVGGPPTGPQGQVQALGG